MNAPEQAIKIYRGDDTDWNGETLLNFTVTADFDISDFTAEFLLGGISKKNISLADGGNFEVNFSHQETAQMPWGLNKGILKIFDADKRIKTVTNDILFWVTNEPVGEQTESIIVPVPETSPVQITLQIGGGGGGGSAYWGGITGDIQNQADLQAEFEEVQGQIDAIDVLIPAQATEENKLADKNFVNSSISTNTAYFIGTFESVAELEAYLGTVTNNDYAFVINSVVTNNGNDWATFSELDAYSKTLLTNFDYAWVIHDNKFDLYRFDIVLQTWNLRAENIHKNEVSLNSAYNRYKAIVVSETVTWEYEYTLNNSSFTAAQWAAIQSGITSVDVTQIGTNTNNISSLQSDKQPKTLVTPITVDGTQQTTVEGALGAVNTLAGKGLANKATGTNSLSILGNATSNSYATNIGSNSRAEANYTLAVGYGVMARGKNTTCVGPISKDYYNNDCTIVGYNAQSESNYGIAIGSGTKAAAVGAIQIGNTTTALITNSNPKTLQVFEYQLLDGNTGKIPSERLPASILVYDNAVSSARLEINKSTSVLQTADNWKYETRFLWTSDSPYHANFILFSGKVGSSNLDCPTIFFNNEYLSIRAVFSDSSSFGYDNMFQAFSGFIDKTVVDLQAVFDGTEYYLNVKKASDTTWTKYSATNSTKKVKFGHQIIMMNFSDYTQPNTSPVWLSKTKITYNSGTVFFDGATAIPSVDYKLNSCNVMPYLGGN